MELVTEEVYQPFTMEILPIEKLILFNFEKNPDSIYAGLELQYINTKEEGNGMRMIAYRKDEYVDVYDQETLLIKNPGKFEVCNKGLKHYRKVPFEGVCFELLKEGMHVEASFLDYKGREINIRLLEHGKKKSKPFDLLAPIGTSSKSPVNLPVFVMYQFDFVRTRHTEISITIAGKDITPDPFPVPLPKDGQMRYFMRYGYDCELVEFGKQEEKMLQRLNLTNGKLIAQGLVAEYAAEEEGYGMKTLTFEQSRHRFELQFEKPFPDLLRMEEGKVSGAFRMVMDPSMGVIAGNYLVEKEGEKVRIQLEPADGWQVKNMTFLTKLLLNKKSVFCTWPKSYRYQQKIDLKTGKSVCGWKRI